MRAPSAEERRALDQWLERIGSFRARAQELGDTVERLRVAVETGDGAAVTLAQMEVVLAEIRMNNTRADEIKVSLATLDVLRELFCHHIRARGVSLETAQAAVTHRVTCQLDDCPCHDEVQGVLDQLRNGAT